MIVTTPDLGGCISGAILYDETIRQKKLDGTSFVNALVDAGINPGIKVDTGAKDMAGHPREKITEWLDGLRERLKEYFQMGARFEWRAVIVIGDGIPSRACIEANAMALASYAALCQEAGLVPIIEPEVLMDGEHSLARYSAVTEEVLRTVFSHLGEQGVALEGMILKGLHLKQQLKEKLIEHKQYIAKNGEDLPEIRNWKWGAAKAGAPRGDLPVGRA